MSRPPPSDRSGSPGSVAGVPRRGAEEVRAVGPEEALAREHALLKILVRTLPDLVWLKDANGVFLACNKEFQNLFGAEEGAIVGRTDDWTSITRFGEVVIAHHDTVIEAGDHVIVFCTRKKLVKKVEKLFQVGFHFL